MISADKVIRWTTAGAVLGVAAVAAVASYEHAYGLVRMHGETGWTARMVPLTVDGLIYVSSMVMLDSTRRKTPIPGLARWLLAIGIAATLAGNVAHGLGHGLIGAAVAAWPAVALVGSYELLMMVIRKSLRRQRTTRPRPIPPPIYYRIRRPNCSPRRLRQIEFHQSARSALNSTSVSHVHSACASTWPLLPGRQANPRRLTAEQRAVDVYAFLRTLPYQGVDLAGLGATVGLLTC
jgi:hypothetical protein